MKDDVVYQGDPVEEQARLIRMGGSVLGCRPTRAPGHVADNSAGMFDGLDWWRDLRPLPRITVAGLELPVADPGVVEARRRKLAASGAKVRGL